MNECISTIVTKDDLANAIKDEYGVLYSKDGKRLLKSENESIRQYTIKEGTEVVCNEAFTHFEIEDFFTHSALESINLPKTLNKIGVYPFPRSTMITCDSPHFKIKNNLLIQGANVIAAIGDSENIVIPDYITSICERTFANCVLLQTIILPEGLKYIGDEAFDFCLNLESITLPDSLEQIGRGTFCECLSLTSINIPNGVTRIEDYTFDGCSTLTEITIPEGVTSIGNYAFCGCLELKTVHLPKNLKSISDGLFFGCSSLKSVDIPNSVTSIGNDAFNSCKLNELIIPYRVASIGDNAFSECNSLDFVCLPDSLEKIGRNPFSRSLNIEDIIWEPQYFRVYNNLLIQNATIIFAFGDLKHYDIPQGIRYIGNSAFAECENLESITLPDSVVCIYSHAFCNCKNLKSITLPDSVENIGCYDLDNFDGLNRKESFLQLPSSDNVFDECESLEKITIIPSYDTDENTIMEKFKKFLPNYANLMQIDKNLKIKRYKKSEIERYHDSLLNNWDKFRDMLADLIEEYYERRNQVDGNEDDC